MSDRGEMNTLPPILPSARDLTPLRPDLDGSQGVNRGGAANQLGAGDDLAAVRQFLAEYIQSPSTQRAYRKEVERLLLWAVVQRGKPLSGLTRADFAAYNTFLADPTPTALWCGPRRRRYGDKAEPALWRPFVGPLGPAARRAALTIINSLFCYLVQAQYLAANPLGLIRQRHVQRRQTERCAVLHRAFDTEEWTALVAALRDGSNTPQAERERYVVALLYFLALRVGELTSHTMGDFRQCRGRWSFFVVGKGHKPAEIPANAALMAAVRRYRTFLGLTPEPTPDDKTPLLPTRAAGDALTARRVNQIIKALVERVACTFDNTAPHRAAHLRQASPHWFRHTALTRQAEKGMHFTHIKANARHSKLDTTMLYIHTEIDERHQEMDKHTWL